MRDAIGTIVLSFENPIIETPANYPLHEKIILMAHLSGNDRARFVREMFTRIAPRYDVMNRLMTFGQDRRWRRYVIAKAKLPPSGGLLLDLGAGTGDLALDAYHRNPTTIPIAADFTFEMILTGRKRSKTQRFPWLLADAHSLPFPGETFEAIVSGFLLRNVIDLSRVLREQYRLIKPGGRIVTLDTTYPKDDKLHPFVRFYSHKIIPLLGQWISGQRDAYVYLPNSTDRFLSAEQLATSMVSVGFRNVGFDRINFGSIAIHWGEK